MAPASSIRVTLACWPNAQRHSRGCSKSILANSHSARARPRCSRNLMPPPRVRIAVIDSGVHASHPHVGGVAGGVGIDADGSEHDDYIDRLGHGTAVAAVIREKAPAVEIFVIKVFDRELAATGIALVAACRRALRERVDIVNLSLGTTNADHEPALAAVVAELNDSGALIVAAGEQDGSRWLPGSLEG